LYKDELTPEEIKEPIRDIAFNAMVKSAIYEDLDPADRAYGGFKKNNVRPAHRSYLHINVDWCCVPDCILHFAAISIGA
jgi:hypothetical protein